MDRQYVVKEQGKLRPTALGTTVSDLLTSFFGEIMDLGFTARMEEELDDVARGERQWVPMLEDFYGPFQKSLALAAEAMPRVKVEEATDEVCQQCGSPMVIKTGRFGRFIACSNFPGCKNTRSLPTGNGTAANNPQSSSDGLGEASQETCEKCGQPMVVKAGRYGQFLSCSNYPTCKNAKPLKTGVKCPRCDGDLVQRRSKARGRTFYSCSRYPECDFVVNQRPQAEPCPECGGLMVSSGASGARCTVCSWKGDVSQEQPVAAQAE